jgi:hypothetical protein
MWKIRGHQPLHRIYLERHRILLNVARRRTLESRLVAADEARLQVLSLLRHDPLGRITGGLTVRDGSHARYSYEPTTKNAVIKDKSLVLGTKRVYRNVK